jgi:hypothetical protein
MQGKRKDVLRFSQFDEKNLTETQRIHQRPARITVQATGFEVEDCKVSFLGV